jgi:hypothetical protein
LLDVCPKVAVEWVRRVHWKREPTLLPVASVMLALLGSTDSNHRPATLPALADKKTVALAASSASRSLPTVRRPRFFTKHLHFFHMHVTGR